MTVLERVVLYHAPDEAGLAMACAYTIATRTGATVGIGVDVPDARRVVWWCSIPRHVPDEQQEPFA